MGMIGPLNLTVGQPYQLNIPRDSRSVTVQVDSQYDVFVSFKMVAPPVVSVSNGEWDDVVRRGHTSTIPVYGQVPAASGYERSRNALSSFQGTMWLLAVNNGALAQTGTVSGRNNVYVTPLSPYDPMPVHAALSTQHDLTSQPRVVSVPVGCDPYAGTWSSGSTATPVTYFISGPSETQGFPIYFYEIAFAPDSTTSGILAFAIQGVLTDASNNALQTLTLAHGAVAVNGTNNTLTSWALHPAHPLMLLFDTAQFANAAKVLVQFVKLGGASLTVQWTMAVDPDISNSVTNPPIGQAALAYYGSNGGPIF